MTSAGNRRHRTVLGAALLGLLAALGFALVGCGEEGVTPDCPPLPLYNVRDASTADDPSIIAAKAAAVEAGCLTPPGTATPD